MNVMNRPPSTQRTNEMDQALDMGMASALGFSELFFSVY